MIRLSLLLTFVVALMIASVYRWYYALCGLLFLTVVTQHPSMPSSMFGVQGMNPWNAVLLVICIAYLMNQKMETPHQAPTSYNVLFLLGAYVLMIIGVTILELSDAARLMRVTGGRYTRMMMIVDGMINPLKYIMVGVLFYLGATSRRRIYTALFCAVLSSLFYAYLMFKTIRTRVFTIDYKDARRLSDKLIGLFANDMGELLSFAIWAGFLLVLIIPKHWYKLAWVILVAAAIPPYISLKSRAGYLAFIAIGLALSLRWRRLLLLLPVGIAAVIIVSPTVLDRVMMGVGVDQGEHDWNEISAGRITNLWPPVIEQITYSPIFGHGRYAILRTDTFEKIEATGELVPNHPHNSYLEILLDAGLVGLSICMAAILGIIRVAVSLLWRKEDRLMIATGALALVAAVAELTAGVAGSSFYATQSSVPYLCVWGVALRAHRQLAVHEQRQQQLTASLVTGQHHQSSAGKIT